MSQGAIFALSLGSIATLSAYLGVAWMRRWAHQHLLDIPNERSSHSEPTPRGGGLLIVLVTLAGLWLGVPLLPINLPLLPLLAFSFGALLIAMISWRDDIRPLSMGVRFGAHVLGACLVIAFVGPIRVVELPLFDSLNLGWLSLPLTFLWLVGLTNAYNFMDGIDGLAGSQAVLAGLGWFVLGTLIGHPMVGLVGILLAGSSLGFLGHNWPPARIFMGDVGSAFLGFSLASLVVFGALFDLRLPVAGILLVWPFVFDTGFTILRRLLRGENVLAAHRSHLYQRLILAGWNHRAVTLLYLGLAAPGAGFALLWVARVRGSELALALCLPLCAVVLWLGVIYCENRAYIASDRAR